MLHSSGNLLLMMYLMLLMMYLITSCTVTFWCISEFEKGLKHSIGRWTSYWHFFKVVVINTQSNNPSVTYSEDLENMSLVASICRNAYVNQLLIEWRPDIYWDCFNLATSDFQFYFVCKLSNASGRHCESEHWLIFYQIVVFFSSETYKLILSFFDS